MKFYCINALVKTAGNELHKCFENTYQYCQSPVSFGLVQIAWKSASDFPIIPFAK